jgi:hypothetical protein
MRCRRGRSDPIDAQHAARAVLARTAAAAPKSAEGTVEVIRHTKIARDTAVKCRTQAMATLKALIITVSDEQRERLQDPSKMALIERCAGLLAVLLQPAPPPLRYLTPIEFEKRMIASRTLSLAAWNPVSTPRDQPQPTPPVTFSVAPQWGAWPPGPVWLCAPCRTDDLGGVAAGLRGTA